MKLCKKYLRNRRAEILCFRAGSFKTNSLIALFKSNRLNQSLKTNNLITDVHISPRISGKK